MNEQYIKLDDNKKKCHDYLDCEQLWIVYMLCFISLVLVIFTIIYSIKLDIKQYNKTIGSV